MYNFIIPIHKAFRNAPRLLQLFLVSTFLFFLPNTLVVQSTCKQPFIQTNLFRKKFSLRSSTAHLQSVLLANNERSFFIALFK